VARGLGGVRLPKVLRFWIVVDINSSVVWDFGVCLVGVILVRFKSDLIDCWMSAC
jgi:hypothetical protein